MLAPSPGDRLEKGGSGGRAHKRTADVKPWTQMSGWNSLVNFRGSPKTPEPSLFRSLGQGMLRPVHQAQGTS